MKPCTQLGCEGSVPELFALRHTIKWAYSLYDILSKKVLDAVQKFCENRMQVIKADICYFPSN